MLFRQQGTHLPLGETQIIADSPYQRKQPPGQRQVENLGLVGRILGGATRPIIGRTAHLATPPRTYQGTDAFPYSNHRSEIKRRWLQRIKIAKKTFAATKKKEDRKEGFNTLRRTGQLSSLPRFPRSA